MYTSSKPNPISKATFVINLYIIWLNKKYNSYIRSLSSPRSPKNSFTISLIIESTRNIIHPGTLPVNYRLTANIIAGYLLVTLLGNSGSSLKAYLINISIIVQILLLILKSVVAIIQSYAFSILATLYSREIN